MMALIQLEVGNNVSKKQLQNKTIECKNRESHKYLIDCVFQGCVFMYTNLWI